MIYTAVEIREPKDAIGTGFLISVQSETTPNRWPYVVTAEHVNRGEAKVYVAAANPPGAGELYEPVLVPEWI